MANSENYFDRVNRSMVRLFGESIVIDPESLSLTINGIYSTEWIDNQSSDGASYRRKQRAEKNAWFITDQLPDTFSPGMVIRVRGEDLIVMKTQPDDGGLTRCLLEDYQ